eukprot:m.79638 g.79638  ORF g.79638 m.79638 type:complete len:318 (+) comp14167_c0_seq2:263-1216(+)
MGGKSRRASEQLETRAADKFQLEVLREIEASGKTLYEVLGVPPDASDEDIKRSYRKLAVRLHPDKNFGKDTQTEFQQVRCAYNVLQSPATRDVYNSLGFRGLQVADQLQGEEEEEEIECSTCGRVAFNVGGALTLGYFFCCFCFCCNCCCGTCNTLARKLFGRRLYHMYEMAFQEAEVTEVIEAGAASRVPSQAGSRRSTPKPSESSDTSSVSPLSHSASQMNGNAKPQKRETINITSHQTQSEHLKEEAGRNSPSPLRNGVSAQTPSQPIETQPKPRVTSFSLSPLTHLQEPLIEDDAEIQDNTKTEKGDITTSIV